MKSVSVKKRPIVAACMLAVAGMLTGVNASAEQKTLYLGMNGGDMQRGFEEHVFPAFEKANNVKIVVVPGTSTDVLAKAQAFKDKPQMHIMFLDDGIMNRATRMGLCEPIKDDKALSELYPETLIGKNMAAGVVTTMTGLSYNTKLFKENNWRRRHPGKIWLIPSTRVKWYFSLWPAAPMACMLHDAQPH